MKVYCKQIATDLHFCILHYGILQHITYTVAFVVMKYFDVLIEYVRC